MNPRTLSIIALSCVLIGQDVSAMDEETFREYYGNRTRTTSRRTASSSPSRYPFVSLPSLQEAGNILNQWKDREFAAIPFNMQKNTPYNYSFLGVNGEGSSLVFSDSDYLVTYGMVAGNYSEQVNAAHVWNAKDFSYAFSVLIRGGGYEFYVHVDSAGKRFVFHLVPEAQGRLVLPGGIAAYHLPSGEFRVKSISGGSYYWSNFSLSSELSSMGGRTFAGIREFNGLKVQVSMRKIGDLQKVPELIGLNNHFAVVGEDLLQGIDFSTFKKRNREQIPHAREIQLESIPGLPDRDDYTTEILEDGNYGYLAIISGNRGSLMQAINLAFMEDEPEPLSGVYIYNPRNNRLLHHPGNPLVETRSARYGYLPFYYDTGIGHLVHNGIASLRGDVGWNGPVLLDEKTGKESVILFQGDKTYGAPIAYHIKSRLKGSDTLGSSLCVWDCLPNDSSQSYWIAGGENVCALILLNEKTKTGKVIQSWSGVWGRNYWNRYFSNPVWIAEKQWLCIPVQENCWEVYEFKDFTKPTEKKCMIYTGPGGAWALMLPDGRYAGSPGCEKLLSAVIDGKRIPMEKLAPWRNRPGEVLEAVGGNADDVAALNATTKRWLSKMNMNPDAMPPEPSAQDFPQADVSRPELKCYSTSESVGVRLVASPKRALTGFDVRVNGASVEQSWSDSLLVPAGRQLKKILDIPLNVGQNNVSLTPIDSVGIAGESINFRMVKPGNSLGRLFVVTLGVSDYDDDGLDLQFAAKDARDLASAFSKYGAGEVKTMVLRDKEVADTGVLEKVHNFLAESTLNDRVVLYLAGHGMLDDKMEYYYAPASFDAERISETGISMESLVATLQRVPARERLMLLDTCHSGQLGEAGEEKLAASGVQLPHGVRAVQTRGMKVRKPVEALTSETQQKRYIEEMFSLGQQYRGVNIVAGAAGAEYALESGQWNNGVFTAAVIQTLQDFSRSDDNKDGVLSVAEMLSELQRKVQTLTGGAQMPNIVCAERSNMLIARGLMAEVIELDFAAVEKRIEAAPDAETALLQLDEIYCFNKGAANGFDDSTWEDGVEKELKSWGRCYDENQWLSLKYAYYLYRPRAPWEFVTTSRIAIPESVWMAAAAKGVSREKLLPLLNIMCSIETKNSIERAINAAATSY